MLVAALAMAILTDPLSALPVGDGPQAYEGDWLIKPPQTRSAVSRSADGKRVTIANGLVSRTFYLGDNLATTSLRQEQTGEEYVRATSPEATVTIDGKPLPVGGLVGQPDLAYLKDEWLPNLKSPENALRFVGLEAGPTKERFAWNRKRHSEGRLWPPPGVRLTLNFANAVVKVAVAYELYDGMPLFSKQIVVKNAGAGPFTLDRFVAERIAFVEPESSVDEQHQWLHPNWSVMTDYSFGGMSPNDDNNTVQYLDDPTYSTQVNYNLKTPVVMEVAPPTGPGVVLKPGEECEGFTVFELLQDSTDRERRGLGVRKVYRALAPWTTESPVMLHLTSTDPATVHTAIDQAAECGFEMVIFSFGSGLNMEDASAQNVAKYKAFADYAHAKGLEIGGYSLLASRHIDDANDAIDPQTMKPGGMRFGYSPCLLSQWGLDYFANVQRFIEGAGFDLLEHDGSYPGDVCASTNHPGHTGLADSQWRQFWKIAGFYRWCRAQGVFLNVPDTYFFQGSNKTGMGYRETNWSLPREQQHVHARQNLFDGTWEKTPTMGWMFVPLVEYQGGGAAATIEPLREHIDDYRQHLMNNFGYGAQACYRGPRLYDTPETKRAVVEAVNWFKAHRDILESDVIHLRRADGRRLDSVLHVNPSLETKAMLVVYNPTRAALTEQLEVPLYYSGLKERANLYESGTRASTLELSPEGKAKIKVTVPPGSCAWYTVR